MTTTGSTGNRAAKLGMNWTLGLLSLARHDAKR
jgi:hypothetical protein